MFDLETVAIICALFFSVILHECAHGLVALWCGDPTARDRGRLTLNPISHIDAFGTVILPVTLSLLRSMGFPLFPIGWAKPVPVNFSRLRHPRRDMFLVGMAGPLTNILIALTAVAFFHLWSTASFGVRSLLEMVMVVNLILAFFNLTPIPPLDGSRMVMSLLPRTWAQQYLRLEPFGIVIVLLLLNIGLFNVIGAVAGGILRWLGVV